MANCVNRSSPEFQKLLKETNLKEDILAAKIGNWQTSTGRIDEFPTKSQVLTYAFKSNLSEKVVEDSIEELKDYEVTKVAGAINRLFEILSADFNRLSNASLKEIKDLFKNPAIGNEFKNLVDRLKDVRDKTNEGVDFQEKVRTIALTLYELEKVVGKMGMRISETDFASFSENEALNYIARYNSFLNEWDEIIDELRGDFEGSKQTQQLFTQLKGEIDQAKKLLAKPREGSLVSILADTLDPARKVIIEKSQKKIDELRKKIENALKRGDTVAAATYEKRIKEIEELFEKENITDELILKTLKGDLGDANAASALFEALINSADIVIFSAKKKINDAINSVYQKIRTSEFNMQKELKPYLEKLGAARFSIYNFNKQLIQSVKKISKEGEEYFTVELMNEFTGAHEQEIVDFDRKIREAEEKNDQDEVIKLRADFARWKRQYMHQEFKDEVYDRYEVWEKDEAGRKAKQLRDEIFAKMNALIRKTKQGSSLTYGLTPEEEIEYEGYLQELRRLGSLTDEYGKAKDKDSMDYKIAMAIQEYNKKTRDIYIWKERKGAFEAARKKQKEYLDSLKETDPTVDVEELLKEWDRNNTRTVIKPEFYVKRKELLENINNLTKKIKEAGDKEIAKSFTDTWEKIFQQLTGYRDQDGQPIGTNLTEEKIEKIKELQDELEALKKKVENLSGLSSEEWAQLSELRALAKLNFLTNDQYKIKKALEAKRQSLGLSDDQKNKFYDLIKQLQELQGKVPTDYYVAKLNQVSSHLGMDFNTETATKLLESPELFDLLQDSIFKSWFEKNHIKVKRYNKKTNTTEEVWERLYVWNQVIPLDEEYFEKTTLEDGTVLMGKPSLKYYYRDVKDERLELKELKEIEKPTVDQQKRIKELEAKEANNTLISYRTEKIVGKTVNNKGEFLPKDVDTLDKAKPDWDKYINKEYQKLKENAKKSESERDEDDYAKFKIIEIYKKYYLDYQEGLPYSERMWYTLPSVRKTLRERIQGGEFGPKSLWKALLERLSLQDRVSQDEEEANVQKTEEERNIIKADLFGNPVTDIPMKYTGIMSEDMVSLNIGKSITQYGLAAESKKELSKIESFITALEDYLRNDSKVKDLNTFKRAWKKVTDAFGNKKYEPEVTPIVKQGESTRLKAVKNLRDEYFKGIYKIGLFGGTRTAIDEWFDTYLLNPIFKLFSLSTLSFDFTGASVNSVVGNFFLAVESVTGRNFSFMDFVSAFGEFHSKVLVDLTKDIKSELGQKSYYGQLFDLFDPSQEFWHSIGEKYDTPGWLNSAKYIKNMFMNPREFGELQISGTTLLAVLRNTEVKTKNGETIKLSDAYEIGKDGIIKLKDNVDFTAKEFEQIKGTVQRILRDTQGNYAKIDRTQAERHAIGSIFFFMRKYVVPLFMDQWHTRRFNGYVGYSSGSSIEIINILKYGGEGIMDALRSKDNVTAIDYIFAVPKGLKAGVSSASEEQVRAAVKGLSIYTTALLIGLILSYWDDDDERKKARRTEKRWSFWKINAITQLLKIKSEIEQYTVLGGRDEVIRLFQNPFMIVSKVSQVNRLLDYLYYTAIGDEEKSEYSDKGGYRKKMERLYGTDNKALIALYKIFGYQGGSLIPNFGEQDKRAAAAKLERTSRIIEGK